MEEQLRLFSGPLPPASASDRDAVGLEEEVAATWGLPLRRRVRVVLRGHPQAAVEGRLELAGLPDLPYRADTPLALRVGAEEFDHRQIVSWVRLD